MKKEKRMSARRGAAVLVVLAMILTAVIVPGSVSAYGPSTMYTPGSSAPTPGSLYARAIQLANQSTTSNNGKMYATFEQYSSGTPVFPIYESTNSGQSWTQVGSVQDTVNGWGMRYQPQLFELPQAIGSLAKGTLLCAGNSIPNDLSKTKIDLYKSTDLGRTWSYVSSIASGGRADPSGAYDPVWEPFLMVYNNKLICFYSDETDSAHSQKIVHKTSTNGTSWGSLVEDVALSTQNYRPGMPVVAKMANGQYIMTFEVVNYASTNPIFFKTSSNPESWNASSVGTQISGGRGTPYVAVMPNGKVVVSDWSTDNLYVNSSNGSGSWTKVACTITHGYSRCLLPLANGRLFTIRGSVNPTTKAGVVYGDQATP